MTTIRDVVERWYDCLARMDVEGFAATMHDDVVLNVAGRTAVSGRCNGKRQLFEETFPKVMANLVPGKVNLGRRYRIFAVDPPIVVGMMEGGAETLDGQRYEQTYCQVFRVEGDQIVELWEFFDTVQAEARLFGKAIDVGEPLADPLRF